MGRILAGGRQESAFMTDLVVYLMTLLDANLFLYPFFITFPFLSFDPPRLIARFDDPFTIIFPFFLLYDSVMIS